ncbi:DUF2065 domain-containing protein [Caenispirillum salinarum]|uniref:DUF2065 domain-containing protein n=1 Tax=Caenispirillum salinarum TaxID=859058 RepID=UPI00384DEBA8
MTEDLLAALALAIALEGAVYALFPARMKAMIAQVLTLPDGALRGAGLAACAVGVLLAWLVRG